MVLSAAGAVVLLRSSFSDLSSTKLRPAVVLADEANGDWLLCQITRRSYADQSAILIDAADFAQGSLKMTS